MPPCTLSGAPYKGVAFRHSGDTGSHVWGSHLGAWTGRLDMAADRALTGIDDLQDDRSKPSIPYDIVRAELAAPPMLVEALFQTVCLLHRLQSMDSDLIAY